MIPLIRPLLSFGSLDLIADDMGVYQVSFDGSGTFGTHKAAAYAGIVGTERQMAALAEAWAALLKKHGLRYFKMAEAWKYYGEFQPKFAEWGQAQAEQNRDNLLLEFATLVKRYDLRVAGCVAGFVNFSDLSAATDKKKRLFQGAVLGLLKWIPEDARVVLMCDIEQDVGHDFQRWIDSLRHKDDAASRITGLCFLDDKTECSIQVADMFAYLARQDAERFIDGRPETEVNPLYKLLLSKSGVTVDVLQEGQFFDGLRGGS
jgi:hypothetical protein